MKPKKIFEENVKCPKCGSMFGIALKEEIIREGIPAEKKRYYCVQKGVQEMLISVKK